MRDLMKVNKKTHGTLYLMEEFKILMGVFLRKSFTAKSYSIDV